MNQLISRHEIAQNDDVIRRLIEDRGQGFAAIANNQFYGEAFKHYLLFTESSALRDTSLSRLSATEVFYNKYYWFLLFTRRHQARHGYDAGLEQQAFKLLENAPNDVDWNLLKEIYKRVESETARQI
jgi:hypothetical protein